MKNFRRRFVVVPALAVGLLVTFGQLSLLQAGDSSSAKVPVVDPKMVVADESSIWAQRFQFGLGADVRYDNNIALAPEGFEEEGWTYSLSPSFCSAFFGDELTPNSLTVGYNATAFYDEIDYGVDVNHDFDALYAFRSGRTNATLEGRYTHIDSNNARDLSQRGESLFLREQRRATSDRYGVELNVDYELSALLDLVWGAGFERSAYDALNDTTSYGTQLALSLRGR